MHQSAKLYFYFKEEKTVQKTVVCFLPYLDDYNIICKMITLIIDIWNHLHGLPLMTVILR